MYSKNNAGWVVGKVSLFYKDKTLEARFEEYPYPVFFVKEYKKIPIIRLITEEGEKYTIFKNRKAANPRSLFDTRKEVENYITGFDLYSSSDRKWFLT